MGKVWDCTTYNATESNSDQFAYYKISNVLKTYSLIQEKMYHEKV